MSTPAPTTETIVMAEAIYQADLPVLKGKCPRCGQVFGTAGHEGGQVICSCGTLLRFVDQKANGG